MTLVDGAALEASLVARAAQATHRQPSGAWIEFERTANSTHHFARAHICDDVVVKSKFGQFVFDACFLLMCIFTSGSFCYAVRIRDGVVDQVIRQDTNRIKIARSVIKKHEETIRELQQEIAQLPRKNIEHFLVTLDQLKSDLETKTISRTDIDVAEKKRVLTELELFYSSYFYEFICSQRYCA